MNLNAIKTQFNNFLQNWELVEQLILESTHVSFGGGSCFLEINENSCDTVLNPSIYYKPSGLLIELPILGEDDYDSESEDESNFDNAIEELEREFKQKFSDMESYQELMA